MREEKSQRNVGKITYGALGTVETIRNPRDETWQIVVRSPASLEISDGYHTMDELYEHRIALYIALCRVLTSAGHNGIWRSNIHADGSHYDGWFILGIGKARDAGKTITYHLPLLKWDECDFADTLDRAPEWDGHMSQDVLERLKAL